MEWIELNTLLGAERFTIYNYSSEYNVQKVLEHYSARGLVDVIQWNMPLVVDTWPHRTKPDIHYFGQLPALQDCLYRNKKESEFIVNVDLDEFIIPRDKKLTWAEMMSALPSHHQSYTFQNTFFRKEWNDTTEEYPNKEIALTYKLVTLLKTRRENKIWAHGMRSKFIARTKDVQRIYVHDVPKVKFFHVPKGTALLHHYRNWLEYDYPDKNKISDNLVVTKYAMNLTENIKNAWENFQDLPMDLHTTD